MPSKCESLKAEYASLLTLKEEFDSAYEEAVRTGNLDRAKELRAELEKKMATLKDKLWPFEYLPQKELKRQYESQRETFQRVGILETLPSGELGIKGIDGKTYPFPTYEEIRKRIRDNKEVLKAKTEQGFQKLLLVPFGMKLDDLIQIYEKTLWKHYEEKKLFVATENPENQPKFPDDLPFDQGVINKIKSGEIKYEDVWKNKGDVYENKNSALWAWDEYKNADINGKLVYDPKEFSPNHQGKTKQELIKEKGGWHILLIEENPNIPREGKGEEIGGRKRLEANQAPNEYLNLIGQGQYQNESGTTPEAWLIQAITLLEEKNQALDDWQGKGSIACNTGACFKSGFVPDAYWNRGSSQTLLFGHGSANRYPYFGARSAVRVYG